MSFFSSFMHPQQDPVKIYGPLYGEMPAAWQAQPQINPMDFYHQVKNSSGANRAALLGSSVPGGVQDNFNSIKPTPFTVSYAPQTPIATGGTSEGVK